MSAIQDVTRKFTPAAAADPFAPLEMGPIQQINTVESRLLEHVLMLEAIDVLITNDVIDEACRDGNAHLLQTGDRLVSLLGIARRDLDTARDILGEASLSLRRPQSPRSSVGRHVAMHDRRRCETGWGKALQALDAACNPTDPATQKVEAAEIAIQLVIKTRVPSLQAMREKMIALDTAGGWSTFGVFDSLIDDIDHLMRFDGNGEG